MPTLESFNFGKKKKPVQPLQGPSPLAMFPAQPTVPNPTQYPQPMGPQINPISSNSAFKTTPVPQVKPITNIPTPNPTINPADFTNTAINPTPAPIIPPSSQASAPGAINTPPIPVISPETQKAYDDANKAYTESIKISPAELSTQEDVDKLIESTKTAYRNTSDQPIPLEFITGQLASIERRATGLAEPLERKLARMQAARTASMESSKFALERTEKKMTEEKALRKPETVTAGSSVIRYNPATGQYENIYTAPKEAKEKKAPTTIETSQGIMQWDEESGNWKSTGYTKPISSTAEGKAADKADKETAAQQTASASLGILNNLLTGDNYKAISGGFQTGSIPWVGKPEVKNQYTQLKSKLALGARSLLKGSGAISDYEAKVLENSTSALGRNLSEPQMEKALKTVRGVIKTNQGMETEISITNPNTGETITLTASGPEIYKAVSEGNVVEYL